MSFDVIFISGVSGCGKTTTGLELAKRIGFQFKDADDFHSSSNILKMRNCVPLTDSDRLPWLHSINQYCISNKNTIVACSALKNSYRDILGHNLKSIFFILKLPRKELEKRLSLRKNHFMHPSLLSSQLATFEFPPDNPDNVHIINCENKNVSQIVDNIETCLNKCY